MQVRAVDDITLKPEQPVAQVERASASHIGVEVLLKQVLHRHRAALLATNTTASKDVSHQAALVIGRNLLAEVA